ncbi:MAG: hypothetical protein DYG89_16230 [Caldilinea sp. CFX5]|nr:hypothetical protein [Caldilinea sp. CFX5]
MSVLLALLSGLLGIFCAATLLGLGASLALEGTGRYRVPANLAWIGVVLTMVSALLTLWLAFVYWRNSGRRVGWGRWIVAAQLLIILLTFGAVAYGDLRAVLYLPLLLGLICNSLLLLST